jgi:uncharacterized SAM-binding protein YcdF (DUF218 family)
MADKNKEGLSQGKGRKRCWWVWIVGIIEISLFLYCALISIGARLIVADPIAPVDAVVILSGGDGDRLDLAIEMHAQGYAKNLVITNTKNAVNREYARDAEDGGFAKSQIYITEVQVDSTQDEARAVRELALENGWTKLMVIMDPYHSFRARLIFRRELHGTGIDVIARPVVGHWFRSPSWFLYPEGWQNVFLEITKLSSYLASLLFN